MEEKKTKRGTIAGRALAFLLVMTAICGFLYTLAVTGIGQLLFPRQANGSIIEAGGKKYGCELLAQSFTDAGHMWGRIMNVDITTYTDDDGNPVMYAAPSNLSSASEEFASLVAERIEKLRAANPEMADEAVPVDLVTCSGSGLDPHISPAAAEYQVKRIAANTDYSEEEIREMIEACTEERFLGIFGEPRVNVLKVNLMLEGILS